MNWIIDLIARYLYTRAFGKFGPKPAWFPFTWAKENECVKESWRKLAREKVFFWRSKGGTK